MADDKPHRFCLCHTDMAEEASQLLGDLANSQRLMVVALLHDQGEMHVNEMVEKLGVNRAALSRQLGRLRDQALVTTRRKHNRIYYSLDHAKAAAIVQSLSVMLSPDTET
ncbi:ArsR/SmtB family transcription factor [Pseudomonadota bacterium]